MNDRHPALPRFSIAILAKAPVAGFAKTRLIPLLGPAGAARTQRGFILRTLRTAAAAGPASITLWCAPDPQQRFFRALRQQATRSAPGLGSVLHFRCQREGDLGQRMADVFAAGAAACPAASGPLLLVGTDCPALAPAHLRAAAAALTDAQADVVLVPAEDGGYVLVGLREPGRGDFGLFGSGIDWSTGRVMAQSRARLRDAGARWRELTPLWDVDEAADWLRWQASEAH